MVRIEMCLDTNSKSIVGFCTYGPVITFRNLKHSCSVGLHQHHKDKGGKFLKRLWCCIGERVQQGNLVLSTELIM